MIMCLFLVNFSRMMELSTTTEFIQSRFLLLGWQTEFVDEDRLVTKQVQLVLHQKWCRLNDFNLLNKWTHHIKLLFNTDPINGWPHKNSWLWGMSVDCQEDTSKCNRFSSSRRWFGRYPNQRSSEYPARWSFVKQLPSAIFVELSSLFLTQESD